jgi:integrase/recombinase XerD
MRVLRSGLRLIQGNPAPRLRPQYDGFAALDRVADAYAATTIAAHRMDYSAYVSWCERQARDSLPATADQLAQYLQEIAGSCALRTLARRLHVIGRIHLWCGLDDPTKAQPVKLAYRRAMKRRAKPPRQAHGLNAKLRDRLVAACPQTLLGVRDRALLAVGYDTLCRRAELVNLQREHLVELPDGSAKVLVARSKNDPLQTGRWAYISAPGYALLTAWLKAAKITEGPLFRPVHGQAIGEGALHPRIVNRTLQSAAQRAGVAPEVIVKLSGHSLRVGAAQDLAIAGRSTLEIMRAGRWYSLSGMIGYVRTADVNVWQAARQPEA